MGCYFVKCTKVGYGAKNRTNIVALTTNNSTANVRLSFLTKILIGVNDENLCVRSFGDEDC
jgi:hypothetical protein